MATEQIVQYKAIPKNSKVSSKIVFKAQGMDASTVTVTLSNIDAGLELIRGTASAGTFDGSTEWDLGSVTAGDEETLVLDFRTTTVYNDPLTFTATVSTESGDDVSSDNVLNVTFERDDNAGTDIAPSFLDGLEIWDGAVAQGVASKLIYQDGGMVWMPEDVVSTFSVTSGAAGELTAVELLLPRVFAKAIDDDVIQPVAMFQITNANAYVEVNGDPVATLAVEANDGGASSSKIDFQNYVARQFTDNATIGSTTVAGNLLVSFHDEGDVI